MKGVMKMVIVNFKLSNGNVVFRKLTQNLYGVENHLNTKFDERFIVFNNDKPKEASSE